MGCDIHIVLEQKDLDRDRWVGVREYGYSSASLFNNLQKNKDGFLFVGYKLKQRNYNFFNDLCGVRGLGSSFGYEPRGLPEDASDLVLMQLSNDQDLHSASWLTMKELEPVLAKHWPQLVAEAVASKLETGYGAKILQQLVDDNISDYEDEPTYHENYRLVFAFDN